MNIMKTATKSPQKKTKKPAKKVSKKVTKKEEQLITKWNPKEKLTLSEELFCLYYVKNEETRRNGTWSYSAAYDKKLEEKDKDDAVWDFDAETGVKTKLIQDSSYKRCEQVCASEAVKLLRKPKISARITELLNEMLTNEIVDGELTKVILQDHDYNPKVRAIQEFNKLRKRTVDTVEHHHSFAKYEGMSDDELEKALKDGEKFFKKK